MLKILFTMILVVSLAPAGHAESIREKLKKARAQEALERERAKQTPTETTVAEPEPVSEAVAAPVVTEEAPVPADPAAAVTVPTDPTAPATPAVTTPPAVQAAAPVPASPTAIRGATPGVVEYQPPVQHSAVEQYRQEIQNEKDRAQDFKNMVEGAKWIKEGATTERQLTSILGYPALTVDGAQQDQQFMHENANYPLPQPHQKVLTYRRTSNKGVRCMNIIEIYATVNKNTGIVERMKKNLDTDCGGRQW